MKKYDSSLSFSLSLQLSPITCSTRSGCWRPRDMNSFRREEHALPPMGPPSWHHASERAGGRRKIASSRSLAPAHPRPSAAPVKNRLIRLVAAVRVRSGHRASEAKSVRVCVREARTRNL